MLALVLASMLWPALVGEALAQPSTLEDHVHFLTAVEFTRGHLLASQEVYAKEKIRAGVHASHPIQEIGNRLWGPVKQVDPALGERVRTTLKAVGQAVEARVPPPQYAQAIQQAFAVLDEAVTRAVPDAVRSIPALQAKVIRELLVAIEEEYEEAYANGRIQLDIEYQDTYGFFRRARALYQQLAPEIRRRAPNAANELERAFAALARAFPRAHPPERPTPFTQVKEQLEKISAKLSTVFGR